MVKRKTKRGKRNHSTSRVYMGPTDVQLPTVGYYRFLSGLQFWCGFLLAFFAAYIAMKIHGEGSGRFPYYAGSFMTSGAVLGVSLIGVFIYDAWQQVLEPNLAGRVRPIIIIHFSVTLIVIPLCIVGLILTIIFGLCPNSKCSYVTNTTFNYGMAAFLCCMNILCIVALFIGIVLFRLNMQKLNIHPQKSLERMFSSHSDEEL